MNVRRKRYTTTPRRVVATILENQLSESQLALRRTGICGSDIAAVVGLAPYRSAFDVWLDKTGQGTALEINRHMKRGIFLEPSLRRWYADDTGAEVAQIGTVVHPRMKRIIATPDGIAHYRNEDRVLELKSPGPWAEDGWGEPGSDVVPVAYLIQGTWQMTATELRKCDYGALIEGDLKHFQVLFDGDLAAGLVEGADKFWTDYVKPNRPPPLSGLDTPYLKARFPKDAGRIIEASQLTQDGQALLERYFVRRQEKKDAEKEVEALVAQIQALMGDASSIKGNGFRIDWKLAKGHTTTDYEAAFREVLKDNPGLAAELEQKHTRIGKGSRRFTPFILKGAA